MTLYRSLVIGLLGACLYLLGQRPSVEPTPAPPVHQAATLIDISSQMDPLQFASLIRLDAGEHIASVERHNGWLDIGVEGQHGDRRVLMLLHERLLCRVR